MLEKCVSGKANCPLTLAIFKWWVYWQMAGRLVNRRSSSLDFSLLTMANSQQLDVTVDSLLSKTAADGDLPGSSFVIRIMIVVCCADLVVNSEMLSKKMWEAKTTKEFSRKFAQSPFSTAQFTAVTAVCFRRNCLFEEQFKT